MLIQANALHLPLADQSVQTVVTSPPYWALRDYGIDGQLGLEQSLDEYLNNMVAVFREVKRVLRDDGTLWLNIGDNYSSTIKGSGGFSEKQLSNAGSFYSASRRLKPTVGPKNICGVPWRLAFRLQEDGWILRSDIIWAKPNPMPESVQDRPTRAHEYVFLFSKSQRYFYDAEAVREAHQDKLGIERFTGRRGISADDYKNTMTDPIARERWNRKHNQYNPSGRNARTVWTFPTEAYPGAHFATFPTELARRCIAAGTSQKGACPRCGKGWERVIDKAYTQKTHNTSRLRDQQIGQDATYILKERCEAMITTLGWQPSCSCDAGEPRPCVVLDPFVGSGTTVLVANALGRTGIGTDLSRDYLRDQAVPRVNGKTLPRDELAEAASLFDSL